MTDKNRAIILAIEADRLPERMQAGAELHEVENAITVLAEAGTWLGPRGVLEEDNRFRQLIPYVILRQGAKVITYVRGATGGEDRLHGRLSIGLGGHIDLPDVMLAGVEVDLQRTLDAAALRELDEEAHVSGPRSGVRWIGLLADNGDAVGQVHLGVVGVVDVAIDAEITALEDSQEGMALMTLAELAAQSDRLERWTAIVLPHLANALG